MKIARRTLFRFLAAFAPLRAWSQGSQSDVVRALAEVVLPSELGAAGMDKTAAAFERWVADYRPGAEMEHGYGFTRLRSKPPSPAATYSRQLDALRPVLLANDTAAKRPAIEAALQQANVTALPQTPDGKHVASDLMSFYFRSSDANDLCYRAAIGRDLCRGLAGSEKEPAPLTRSR